MTTIDFTGARTRKDYLERLSVQMAHLPPAAMASAWLYLSDHLEGLSAPERLRGPRFNDLFQAIFSAHLKAANRKRKG